MYGRNAIKHWVLDHSRIRSKTCEECASPEPSPQTRKTPASDETRRKGVTPPELPRKRATRLPSTKVASSLPQYSRPEQASMKFLAMQTSMLRRSLRPCSQPARDSCKNKYKNTYDQVPSSLDRQIC